MLDILFVCFLSSYRTLGLQSLASSNPLQTMFIWGFNGAFALSLRWPLHQQPLSLQKDPHKWPMAPSEKPWALQVSLTGCSNLVKPLDMSLSYCWDILSAVFIFNSWSESYRDT